MKKLKIFASSITTLFLILFSSTPVLAGGGGVYADTTYTDDSHWNIVRVYFDPKAYTCKGMVVSFNYANTEDGDKISGGNGDNSSTISEDAHNEVVNGTQYLRCSTYAKVYSSTLKYNRLLNIFFKGPNGDGSRTIAVSFGPGLNYGSFPLLPWEGPSDFIPAPTPTQQPTPKFTQKPLPPKGVPELPEYLTLNILGQTPFEGPMGKMRHVLVKWISPPTQSLKYIVYFRPDNDAPLHTGGWASTLDLLDGPSTTVDLSAKNDWYIRVETCIPGSSKCVSSKSAFLPKINIPPVITPNPTPTATITPSPNDSKVDELNKKIAILQKKVDMLQNLLAESRQAQSDLQKRINELVSIIKKFLPSFK